MPWLVYVRTFDGRAAPQVWAERSYAVDTAAEDQRIISRQEVPEKVAKLPLTTLATLCPPHSANLAATS